MTPFQIAKSKLGLHEVRDNKKIREFLKSNSIKGDINIDPSTTAWCAAFVNACEREGGYIGNGRLNARSFLTYGDKVELKNAQQGDIVVFARGGSTWQGHVAYLDKVVKDKSGRTLIQTIGGNQSDSVSIGWYTVDRLLGIRRYED